MLERFGLPLSTWDNEDWPRLMRAVEVMRIQQIETTRIQQQQGLIKNEHIKPDMWQAFTEHDRLIAEIDETDGTEPD